MKKIIFVIFQVYFVFRVSAQEISIDVKSTGILKDKFKTRTIDTKVIGKDSSFTYFLCSPFTSVYSETAIGITANFFIAKCDHTPKLLSKIAINLKYKDKDRMLEGIYLCNNKFLLFTSFQNLEHKKHYLFAQNLNKDSLEPIDSLKLIGEIDYSAYNQFLNTNFYFSFSEDKSKILVFYNLVSKDNEIIRIGMCVYDNKLNLIWKNDSVTSQILEGVFNCQKYSIDNEGNVYLLGKKFKDIKEYEKLGVYTNAFLSGDSYYTYYPNYEYQLYKYSKNSMDLATVNIPNKFITSLNFSAEAQGSVICTGIYSSLGTISATGCFTLNVDVKTNKISNLSIKEFGEMFYANTLKEIELQNFRHSVNNDKEWDPYHYLLSNIKIRENGDKYFIAEQYIRGKKKQSTGRTIYIYPTYSYRNLFVINLDENNKIGQLDKIEKDQYTIVNDQNSSYFTFEKSNNLYFVFMDIIRKNTFLKNYEFGNTFLVKLDPTGKQQRIVLKNTAEDSKLLILPRSSAKIGSGEIIYSTISTQGRNYTYDKINVKD